MTSLLTISHFVDEANSFIDSVRATDSTHYVFTARPQPWSNTSGGDDDSAVQAVNNSVAQVELDVYRDLLYGKLIGPTDVTPSVVRYDWTANTVYAQYDHRDANMYSKNFYVVTTGLNDQYNVFKCIDNNGNSASTVKPTLQATGGTFETGDGYTWKFMYTVDVTANGKFTTQSFIPVTANVEVSGNAVPGTIDVVRITNGGSGYSVFETGTLSSVIDSLTLKLPDPSSAEDNYYANSSIYLKSGFGAGQVKEIASYIGATRAATLVSPIDFYIRLDFSNSSFITGGGVGETVRQVIDNVAFTNRTGFFNAGDTLIQSDSSVAGTVLSANSSVLRVSRLNKAQSFTSNGVMRSAADSGSVKTDKVSVSNSSALALGIVVTPGSGYTGNATITITSTSGTGGTANATANSTGKITAINVSNSGIGYTREPTVSVSAPTAQTFNANTDVTDGAGEGANNVIALATSNVFVVGDRIRYTVSTGNVAVGGLTSNTVYFVQFANDTVVALSNSSNTSAGNRIALTKGTTESGHSLQGISATGRILPQSLYAINATASSLTTDYANGDFIRVGQNANTNIRRIETVNSTVIVVDKPFSNTISGANTFKISTAVLPTSVTVTQANGTISNTNLNAVTLSIANVSVSGSLFIVGERATMVDSSNVSLSANGTIAYSNSSTLFLSGVQGTWTSGQRVRGGSSDLVADIVSLDSRPNVTVKNPSGTFLVGQDVDFLSTTGSNTGLANLVSAVNLSENSIEYEIAPTVKVTGDGTGFVAVSTVDTSVGTGNAVNKIVVIDPGTGYTRANVQIYANTLYGSGATADPVISPVLGHGADPVAELGGRYASVTVKFNTLANENWYYPSTVSFRKIGVLKSPKFANCTIDTADYDSVELALSSQSGTWEAGEVVVQDTSNATGIVVSGNSTTLNLKDARGTFVQSNTLYAYSSGSTANVTSVTVVPFEIGETVTQANTGSVAKVSSVVGNTVYLTEIVGQLANGQPISGSTSGARANVASIASPDGTRDLTDLFADRFNQTSRVTLSSVIGSYSDLEYVTQDLTGATGRIVALGSDIDLTVSSLNGTFSTGDTVTNSNTSANARVLFANSTYLKLTAVSNTLLFSAGNEVENGLGANATVDSVRSVIVLADVHGNNFSAGLNLITGSSSGAQGTASLVTNPDLKLGSGTVLYTEASNSVINRTSSTTEEIRLTIKF